MTAAMTAIPLSVAMPAMTVAAEEPVNIGSVTIDETTVINGQITDEGWNAGSEPETERKYEGDVVIENLPDGESAAVKVSEGGTIEVTGNVTNKVEQGDGINATNGTVTVGGNVTATNNGEGIIAGDSSGGGANVQVVVGGDVNGGSYGVKATEGSGNTQVVVVGSVTGGNYNNTYDTNDGVHAEKGAEVEVGKDVTSKLNIGVNADGSEVSVSGNVTGETRGVEAKYKAEVAVGEDVTSKTGLGVYAADESTVIVDGDVKGKTGVSALNFSEVTVKGNVAGTAGIGVSATDGSKVTVGTADNAESGNISAQATAEAAVSAYNSEINVTGNVTNLGQGISAEGAIVNVTGDVTSTSSDVWKTGVYVRDNSKVNIGGDVTYGGAAAAIYQTGSDVEIGGNVSALQSGSIGIVSEQGTVVVEGDVFGASVGVSAQTPSHSGNDTAKVIVENTIKSEETGVKVSLSSDQGKVVEGEEADAAPLPTVTVYNIDAPTPVVVEVETQAVSEDKLDEYIAQTIKYIIDAGENISIGEGAEYNEDREFYTAALNKGFIITLATGYELDEYDASIVKYENGTVTLINAKGGIKLNAKKIAEVINDESEDPIPTSSDEEDKPVIPQPSDEEDKPVTPQPSEEEDKPVTPQPSEEEDKPVTPQPSKEEDKPVNPQPINVVVIDEDEEPSQDPAPVQRAEIAAPVNPDSYGAPHGMIKVRNATLDNPLPEVVSGAVLPMRSVSFNMYEVTPAQYKSAFIDNVSSAPMGGMLRIETDTTSCFDAAMINSIATRSDLGIELIFPNKTLGKKWRVVIPAGYNVASLLDANGFVGFMHLAEVFGYTEIEA